MPAGLILLIEDDALQQRFYSGTLQAAGYSVVACNSGEEAPKLCDLHAPRLLVLDINLPGITGIETCKRIRREHVGTAPIIFVTAVDKLEILRECIEVGGDDFMVKGADIKSYLERVGYWMHRRCLSAMERNGILRKVTAKIDAAPEAEIQPAPPGPSHPAMEPVGTVKPTHPLVEPQPTHTPIRQEAASPSAVASMVAFIDEARSGAPADFGRDVKERFTLLGYASGVVNAFANTSLEAKLRFAEHLRSVLGGARLMTESEIDAAIERWYRLYDVPVFREACLLGEAEFQRRLSSGRSVRPTPIHNLMTA
ncbi:MAG: response regulator [Proteobacteria bacterium]|nr:response regulator [Pseudomonadota bacterium]MBI3496995.1 response regulator [Pseudomonadota bacterium]